MIRIERYRAEDLLMVKRRPVVEKNTDRSLLAKFAQGHAKDLAAFTVWDENKEEVLGCFGVKDMWPGTGQLWSVFADGALAIPGTYRELRFLVDQVWNNEVFGYNRWQAMVAMNDLGAARLVEHLGMEKEGLMRRYGPNDVDHWLYARVR